jgi:hypothetical protein
MLIRAMSFIKLSLYPMEALEETALFLYALGEHYNNAVSIVDINV